MIPASNTWRTSPLIIFSLAAYTLFLVFCAVGLTIWRSMNGLVFLWPYPLLLAFQKWIDPGRLSNFALASVLGGVLVLVSARALQRVIGIGRPRIWLAALIAAFFWYLPLLGLQVVAYLMALAFGWPYGE